MPVATAVQAEVVTAYLDPLEVRRRGQHPAQQLVVVGLDLGALTQGETPIRDPLGQVVPQLLQLAEVEDPRLGRDRSDAVVDLDPAEGLGDESGQLTLEMADLAPQLHPGEALVDVDAERHRSVSCEQIRHRPRTSVDHRSVSATIQSASETAICGTPLTWMATIASRWLAESTP